MDGKILALMALLSLAALAAGYPTKDDQHYRTDMEALRLFNKIAREQVFKQGKETDCIPAGALCYYIDIHNFNCCPGSFCPYPNNGIAFCEEYNEQ